MIELAQIHYDAGSHFVLNLVLAAMILGLALDIKTDDFLRVFRNPKAPSVGLAAQFLLLPALTCGLTLLLDLPPGIELGMILVAACPGGSISNFVTYLARGNVALSISMTAFASLIAIFLMPLNFAFWSGFNPEAVELLREIDVDGSDIFKTLLMVLAIPIALGQAIAHFHPKLASILHKGLKNLSLLALFAFIGIAIFKNFDAFAKYFILLFFCVLIHNGTALALGWATGKLSKLNTADRRAVMIEVGMQNSSLAIAIVFTQFDAQPGMALIAAFWGTWHIVSGLLIALVCRINSRGKSETGPHMEPDGTRTDL